MRYGLITDLHANYQATHAVISDAKDNVDTWICLGDILGYGPSPNETMDLLWSLSTQVMVAGNHDLAIWEKIAGVNLLYPQEDGGGYYKRMNTRAQSGVDYNASVLKKTNTRRLESLVQRDLHITQDTMSLSHGDPSTPKTISYVDTIGIAEYTFHFIHAKHIFVGHLHVPLIFTLEHGIRQDYIGADYARLNLHDPEKSIVTVPSAGFPRDGNPKAGYAVFDTDTETLEIKRIHYDLDAEIDSMDAPSYPIKDEMEKFLRCDY